MWEAVVRSGSLAGKGGERPATAAAVLPPSRDCCAAMVGMQGFDPDVVPASGWLVLLSQTDTHGMHCMARMSVVLSAVHGVVMLLRAVWYLCFLGACAW